MRHIHVIGIGAGNPDHVSIQAISAMREVDVFFVIDKGPDQADLVAVRREICQRHLEPGTYRWVHLDDPPRDRHPEDYAAEVRRWHDERAARLAAAMATELADDGVGALMVWGDPSLYDSTLRLLDDIHARGGVAFTHGVVPGISSVSALAAAHRIALHGVGEAMVVTTGRRLAGGQGWPDGVANAIVMLDGDCSFRHLDPAGIDIWWGAYLGTPEEILVAGALVNVGEEIRSRRAEGRASRGWIMDIYLLRRSARLR